MSSPVNLLRASAFGLIATMLASQAQAQSAGSAEAEIALVSRDLTWPAKALDAARAALEQHGDRVNAAYARYLEVRRLLLIGRLDEAERALAALDPAPFPPASRAAYELVVAGIAMRRLRTKAARAALARAKRAARRDERSRGKRCGNEQTGELVGNPQRHRNRRARVRFQRVVKFYEIKSSANS